MNEHIKAAIIEAQKQGKLFFYSANFEQEQNHESIEICLDCDAILVPEKFRDEVYKKA
jgi:hypothetical protein